MESLKEHVSYIPSIKQMDRLAVAGGGTVGSYIRRMLRIIAANAIWERFNVEGGFSKMALNKTLRETIIGG